jgi:hypothetical protein
MVTIETKPDVVRLDAYPGGGRLNVGLQRLLVAAEQLGDVAAFGRLGQELRTLQRPLHHHGAVQLQQGVMDQHTAPFAQQAQGIVQLGSAVCCVLLQLSPQLILDAAVMSHLGKCCLANSRN